MSDHTQFIFISHNKITMEMADQLIGVTMPELGVSRVVAVDIEEALKLQGGGGRLTGRCPAMSDLQLSLIVLGADRGRGRLPVQLAGRRAHRQRMREAIGVDTPRQDVVARRAVRRPEVPDTEACKPSRTVPSRASNLRSRAPRAAAEPDLPSISQERAAHHDLPDPHRLRMRPPRRYARRQPHARAPTSTPGRARRRRAAAGELRARAEQELGGSAADPDRSARRRRGSLDLADPDMRAGGSDWRIALQLADRRGAVAAAHLARFREIVDGIAADLGASVSVTTRRAALAQARGAGRVLRGRSTSPSASAWSRPGSRTLQGTTIRALAEADGFALRPTACSTADDRGASPSSRSTTRIRSRSFPRPFADASSRRASRFLLDVPRVQRWARRLRPDDAGGAAVRQRPSTERSSTTIASR